MATSVLGIKFFDMKKTVSVLSDAMSFARRSPYHAGIMVLKWDDPTKDESCRAWGRFLQSKFLEEVKFVEGSSQSTHTLEYVNYFERMASPLPFSLGLLFPSPVLQRVKEILG